MGIGLQELQFLANTSEHGNFERVLTIGRQGLHVHPQNVDRLLNVTGSKESKYCEDLFKEYFGATSVDSVDYSNYEGANIIHDMNTPLPYGMEEYDTIIDFGTLEHVYNINQAFTNLSELCAVGGQILHSLPANNNCGHGFWQFSPELFFALYSEKNGYKDTQVFIGDTADLNWTFELDPLTDDERHDIKHHNPVYTMVRTVLATKDFSHKDTYQTDYKYQWNKAAND